MTTYKILSTIVERLLNVLEYNTCRAKFLAKVDSSEFDEQCTIEVIVYFQNLSKNHETMKQVDWVQISLQKHPRDVRQFLLQCSSEVYESFDQCRSMVYITMFQRVYKVLQCLSWKSTQDTYFMFSALLAKYEYIPPLIERTISNDRFFHGHHEWKIANVQCMRMYWDKLFRGISLTHRQTILDPICQYIVRLLPGEMEQCKTCNWTIPSQGMHYQSKCSYCVDKNCTDLQQDKRDLFVRQHKSELSLLCTQFSSACNTYTDE